METDKSGAGFLSNLKKSFDEVALWVGLVFIAALIAVAFYNIQSGSERSRWVSHTYEVLRESDKLISAMKDAETGQRGYLLTGADTYLQPYTNAKQLIESSLNKLKTLTSDNAKQQQRLEEITAKVTLKLAELNETVNLRRESGLEAALEVVKTDKGKQVMDDFRQLIHDFQQEEELLLLQRAEQSDASTSRSLLIQGIGGLLVVTYLSFALISVRKQKKNRKMLFSELDKNNKEYLLNNGNTLQEEQEIIQSLVTNLQSTKEFIRKVGSKQYEVQLAGISQEQYHLNKDNMAGALLEVRDLLKANDQEADIRQWTNEGIAKFSDLIRHKNQSLEGLAQECLQSLIKYLKVNQGALYVVNEDNNNDTYLEMAACYAWNKKKYVQKRIDKGEGLAGQAWLEGDSLYLTEVPKDYVSIKSGLGEANPNAILIVPLKVNEEVLGILELASFYTMQPYEIQFVEKVGESLAAALNGAKINERTQKLLEVSQQQAEELRATEEEMRQNTEELEATQEEMRRGEIEMRGQLTAIDSTLATIEFDMLGQVRKANEIFLSTMGYRLDEIKGRHHRLFCESAYTDSHDYAFFWQELGRGIAKTGEFKRKTKSGAEVWLRASYTPVFDANGKPYKIIKLAFDITEEKRKADTLLEVLQEAH